MGIKVAVNGFGRVGCYIVLACIGAELFTRQSNLDNYQTFCESIDFNKQT
jgi:hypothetical protein